MSVFFLLVKDIFQEDPKASIIAAERSEAAH